MIAGSAGEDNGGLELNSWGGGVAGAGDRQHALDRIWRHGLISDNNLLLGREALLGGEGYENRDRISDRRGRHVIAKRI
jgi:hypothetical protein